MAASPQFRMYSAELEDRFDKAGIIAAAIVRDDGPISSLDTFLMSCRVIGRGVEQALLERVARDARERGQSLLAGEYIPTAKNELVKGFFAGNGFARRSAAANGTMWDLALDADLPHRPDWFKTAESKPEAIPV
jgi:predicted enzyme involved in methoxymalonyl-ACP biosynthesis